MLIALHQLPRRHRRRLAAVALVLALCCLGVAAHGALTDGHMGAGAAVCVAVAQTAALGVALAIASMPTALRHAAWDSHRLLRSIEVARRRPVARARGGPAVLQVFQR